MLRNNLNGEKKKVEGKGGNFSENLRKFFRVFSVFVKVFTIDHIRKVVCVPVKLRRCGVCIFGNYFIYLRIFFFFANNS